jgi:hypothetical protein
MKKLTVFNADGSIKVAGFVPWMGYETNPVTLVLAGHRGTTPKQVRPASDPK